MIEPEETIQKDYPPPRLSWGPGYYDATAAPTASNDVTQGFSIGAHWYKKDVPIRLWICVFNTTGGALWREIVLVTSYDVLYLSDTVTYLGDQVIYT